MNASVAPDAVSMHSCSNSTMFTRIGSCSGRMCPSVVAHVVVNWWKLTAQAAEHVSGEFPSGHAEPSAPQQTRGALQTLTTASRSSSTAATQEEK